MKKKILIPFAFMSALGLGTALAQEEQEHRRHHPLPEEAFAACKDLNEGDACTAKRHDHEIKGLCAKGHQERLWCRPSGPPPPPPPDGR